MVEHSSLGPLEPNRLVNRKKEIDAVGAALAATDDKPRIFYFPGGPGVGKSRLLREARKKFENQYTFAGFYDFDDTELHSNSVLERRIRHTLAKAVGVNGDPDENQFKTFRDKRKEFIQERRSGVSESKLEELRQELAELFVQGINEISAQKKLLFCFDTVETLQREGDTVAFPQEIQNAIEKLAIEMFGWLTKNLPKMRNVVVLLAGRPKTGLDEQFARAFGDAYQKFKLDNFSLEYVQEYLEVMAKTYEEDAETHTTSDEKAKEKSIARQFRGLANQAQRIYDLTNGQPILLSFVTDLIHNGVGLPEYFKSDASRATSAQVNMDLMNLVKNDIHNDIELALPYIALLRKGVTPAILHKALQGELPDWDTARCEKVLQSMRGLSFAKPFPSNRKPKLERMHLHDEVYDVIGEKEIGPHIQERYVKVCQRMVQYYDNEVDAAENKLKDWQKERREIARKAKESGSKISDDEAAFEKQSDLIAEVNRLKAKRLYYQLEADPFDGYAKYSRLSDRAIIDHQVGLDMMLRDEMLRYFDLAHPDNWRLARARKEPETDLSPERIMRGAAIRWVQRLNAHGQARDAIAMAQVLQTNAELREELHVEDKSQKGESHQDKSRKGDPLFDAIVKTYEAEAYLNLDTNKTIQVAGEAIKLFEDAPLADRHQDLSKQLRPRHLGRAYNNRGYAHARENRFQEAIVDYQAALPLLRETGLPHQTAGTLINLAFAYANTGQLLAANILCHEAIQRCRENKLGYLEGLGLNTLGFVELTADRPHRAAALAGHALEIFEGEGEGENRRGMGLANLVLGKANRARAQLGIYNAQETTKLFEESQRALDFGYETFKTGTNWHEPARELEALQALGCLYRQWAQWEKTRANGSPAQVQKLVTDSQKKFEMAQELIAKEKEKYVGADADILNDMAELYWIQDDKTRALDYADKSDAAVRAISKNYFIAEHKQPEEPRLYLYVILGKNELLRGRVALKEGELAAAAQRYAAASAYFDRFEGDQTTRELTARRIYRIYRDLLDAIAPPDNQRLSAREIDKFRQDVEQFQKQNLARPWPHHTTTLGDNFNAIWADLHRVLDK